MLHIEIGDANLKDLTKEQLIEIILIEGCTLHLDYWKQPVILDFSNKMFSDTLVIDFNQFRKEDNLQGRTIVFFFNFKDFSYHWHFKGEENDFSNTRRARVKMETIKYLIKNGFDVPLY
jgi:hypothetical protein